jgi:hypothetical protein
VAGKNLHELVELLLSLQDLPGSDRFGDRRLDVRTKQELSRLAESGLAAPICSRTSTQ